ncbi:MAG TPA: heme exporter protein CcmD [Pyrinomonadaceae bacterium]|nr:heme exporter protein CcmD [Pyrinomonadaceae bacterium]
MNWPDLSMGGYGFYVWGSYLFALVLIVWEVVSLRQRKKALANEEKANEERSATVRTSVLRGSTNETTS